MSQVKKEEKRKKKLKSFFDKNASLSKRWRSLLSFTDKATDEELNKFFNENFYMIYGVFWDSFSAYEAGCKKGKHSNTDVMEFCGILRHVLVHLSELIRKKWQTRSIATVLEHLLYKENKIFLREKGLELLLLFIEAIQVLEPSQVDLFAASIDLAGFCTGIHQGVKLKVAALSAPDKGSVLVPSVSAGNLENVVKLWGNLLTYVTSKPQLFEFWLDLLKQHFFSVFYPAMSHRMSIITSTDIGFLSYCPSQIQALNIAHLDIWVNHPQVSAIRDVLWGNETNIQLVLEILRQSCQLPISEAETIHKSIALMKSLFFTGGILPESLHPRLSEFRRFFFAQLATVFRMEADVNNQQVQIALCLQVVQEFKNIYLDSYHHFDTVSQEALLHTLLQISVDVFSNPNIVNSLADTTLDTVLFIWIKTGRGSESMWNALHQKISSLFTHIQPVKQLKIKLVQLTLIIKELIYPERKSKKKVHATQKGNFETIRKDLSPSVSPDDKVPLPAIPKDANIVGIDWTVEEVTYVWKQMLNVMQDINTIADPTIHAEGIQALSDIIEILQQAEENIPESAKKDMKYQPINLIDVFGRYLFEAAVIPSATFITGKSYAIGTLCRMIVRHHSNSIPLELLSHFYGTLYKCLRSHPNSIVSQAILQHSSNIFNLALPGSSILIPHYVSEIKALIKNGSCPASIKMRAIIITCSLICYPAHLSSMTCTMNPLDGSDSEYCYSTQLKTDICEILTKFLEVETISEHISMCIWGCCCLIFEEFFSSSPDINTVKIITRSIFPLCTSKNNIVARSALDCLSTLAQISDKIVLLDPKLVAMVVDILCANIQRLLMEQRSTKKLTDENEQLISDHFYCLLDWVMCNSTHIMNNSPLASKLFGAIEQGILGQTLDPNAMDVRESKKKTKDFGTLRGGVATITPVVSDEQKLTTVLESLLSNPAHGSQSIKEAAHILLIQLCNFLQTFPSKEGVTILSSQVDENESETAPIFYISNNFALFSISEITNDDGSTFARLMLRDCTGKYAWDCTVNHNNNIGMDLSTFDLKREPYFEQPPCEAEISYPSKREKGEPPLNPNDPRLQETGPVDPLDDLLQYLSEAYPDCLLSESKALNQPHSPREEFRSGIAKIEKSLLEQVKSDALGISNRSLELKETEMDRIVTQPQLQENLAKHQACRLLLNHLGFLDFDKQSRFYMVEDTQRFRRSLTQLDKTAGREVAKIGVIYVKEGQDDQKIIFRNDTKSPLYAEFVRGLGWPIDVASHQGYLGGLDKKLTTGVTAPYFANYLFEVAFHEITSMPTNPTDNQQIHKKRHVGNDIVHIIYSEHTSDYRPTTITSQFNDAHVVVYPLPNGLFRIQIYRKEKVQTFGPLVHGMCVSKNLLPMLVRLTAINANRCVRFNTGVYSRPFPTRSRALDEIMSRFKNENTFVDVLSALLD